MRSEGRVLQHHVDDERKEKTTRVGGSPRTGKSIHKITIAKRSRFERKGKNHTFAPYSTARSTYCTYRAADSPRQCRSSTRSSSRTSLRCVSPCAAAVAVVPASSPLSLLPSLSPSALEARAGLSACSWPLPPSSSTTTRFPNGNSSVARAVKLGAVGALAVAVAVTVAADEAVGGRFCPPPVVASFAAGVAAADACADAAVVWPFLVAACGVSCPAAWRFGCSVSLLWSLLLTLVPLLSVLIAARARSLDSEGCCHRLIVGHAHDHSVHVTRV